MSNYIKIKRMQTVRIPYADNMSADEDVSIDKIAETIEIRI